MRSLGIFLRRSFRNGYQRNFKKVNLVQLEIFGTLHNAIPVCMIKRAPFRSFGVAPGLVEVTRDPRFSRLTEEDISYFRKIIGSNGVVTDQDDLQAANTDWMHKYKGSSSLLLRPYTTEQVSAALHYCNSRKIAVVPQGGNTGLVGGSVPVFDEVILNLGAMNQIISFDKPLFCRRYNHC